MRALILALLVTSAQALPLEARFERSRFILRDTQCTDVSVLPRIKPEYQSMLKGMSAVIDGRVETGCWMLESVDSVLLMWGAKGEVSISTSDLKLRPGT